MTSPLQPAASRSLPMATAAAWQSIASHVLVFEVPGTDEERTRLAQIFDKLQAVGLRINIVTTPSGRRQAALISAGPARLEQEAVRRKISMRLKEEGPGGLPLFTDFIASAKGEFELKAGELFSPMEKQRLVCCVAEGAEFRGGAELDLDGLVADKVFLASMPLHTAERAALWASWSGIRLWPSGWPHGWPNRDAYAQHANQWPLPASPVPRRILPDLGLLQQPVHAIKAYFGSKIAFYFAWAETYTCWLLCVVFVAVPLEVVRAAGDDSTDAYVRVACTPPLPGLEPSALNTASRPTRSGVLSPNSSRWKLSEALRRCDGSSPKLSEAPRRCGESPPKV